MGIYNNPKETILCSAKEIATQEGITKINIRSVAKKSGISIGTVYNYYPTKADLLVAVIEDFWRETFIKLDINIMEHNSFYEKIEEVYNNLYTHFHNFKENWLEQLSLLNVQEKKLGRKKESEYFIKVYNMIILLMDSDESIDDNVWENGLSKEKVAEFILDNMLLMLKKDESDCGFFIIILKRIMTN